MKDFWDAVATVILLFAAAALVFVFQGDPDIWDRAHAKVMHKLEAP